MVISVSSPPKDLYTLIMPPTSKPHHLAAQNNSAEFPDSTTPRGCQAPPFGRRKPFRWAPRLHHAARPPSSTIRPAKQSKLPAPKLYHSDGHNAAGPHNQCETSLFNRRTTSAGADSDTIRLFYLSLGPRQTTWTKNQRTGIQTGRLLVGGRRFWPQNTQKSR